VPVQTDLLDVRPGCQLTNHGLVGRDDQAVEDEERDDPGHVAGRLLLKELRADRSLMPVGVIGERIADRPSPGRPVTPGHLRRGDRRIGLIRHFDDDRDLPAGRDGAEAALELGMEAPGPRRSAGHDDERGQHPGQLPDHRGSPLAEHLR
jgi:hypothetical protein